MAIKFGGTSAGFKLTTPAFDTRTFDCGTDYKLFINRIDKVCRQSKQINDALCDMKTIIETYIKPEADGDCIQRVAVTVAEVPYNPVMEARNPCTDIEDLPLDEPLLASAMGDCDPGCKAIEVNITASGYGEGKAFLTDTTIIPTALSNWADLSEIVDWINLIDRWIIQDYGYEAPQDDFHTFNLSLRGTLAAPDSTTRIDQSGCDATTMFRQARLTCNVDFVGGVIRVDREVTYMGEYNTVAEAVSDLGVVCGP